LLDRDRAEDALRRLVVVLERRHLDDDDSRAAMELARAAAGRCSSPRVQMTAWLLAGELGELERLAHGNHEAAMLCAVAGVGSRSEIAETLLAAGYPGHAALLYEDAGLAEPAVAAWNALHARAAAAGERYIRDAARLRAAQAEARARGARGADSGIDGGARALEVLGDSFTKGCREHRAYECYMLAAAALDGGYVRQPVVHEKLRRLVADCLIPAVVCQLEAQIIEDAMAARHVARAQLLAKRALAYADDWQPRWSPCFRRATSGKPMDVPDELRGESFASYAERALRGDLLSFEAGGDPAILFGLILLDRTHSERDRRLAGALRLHFHTHEDASWADDEVVKVVEACGRMSASVSEAVLEGYATHSSPRVRMAVAKSSPRSSRRALEWLARLGGDPSREVREAAAEALCEHRSPTSLSCLISLWESARSEAISDAAAKAIAELRRWGAPELGVPSGDDFDRLVASRQGSDPQQLERLLAQVRGY